MQSARYNPQKQMILCKRILLLVLVAVWVEAAMFRAHAAVSREQPVADLAKQIAAIAGPGPAKLTIRNSSSLTADELPGIRQQLERELRTYGITTSNTEAATAIRVTLSENAGGGLWVAEVQDGTEVRVAMVSVDLGHPSAAQAGSRITLRKALLWQQRQPILDLLVLQSEATRRMIVLEPEKVVSYVMTATGWTKEQEFAVAHDRPFPRDVRGLLVVEQGHLFAYLPGVLCNGSEDSGTLTVACADSDDPWPLPNIEQKAFYNIRRNYFTGVLAPGFGMQMQPFYSAAVIPRANSAAALFSGIDGKLVLIENNMSKPIVGVRDWGSDFAAVRSGCGSGAQLLVSGSGTAPTDSVRAYEIPGREAEPVSEPLELNGQVMAMWPAADEASATVIVRTGEGQALAESYEVYSVSPFCN